VNGIGVKPAAIVRSGAVACAWRRAVACCRPEYIFLHIAQIKSVMRIAAVDGGLQLEVSSGTGIC
jgi:hypothetical protein